MKVEVTVIAEFPEGISYGVIEKLARQNGHPAVLQNATVTHGLVQKPGGAKPRRIVRWKAECVDIEDTTSEDVFNAQVLAAKEQGIRLVRRIKKLQPDVRPSSHHQSPVFWTWGDEFLENDAPAGRI